MNKETIDTDDISVCLLGKIGAPEIEKYAYFDQYLDMYVCFKKKKSKEDEKPHIMRKSEFESLGIPEKELLKIAKRNTRKDNKIVLYEMTDLLEKMRNGGKAKNVINGTEELTTREMYVCTLENGMFGAAAMLYEEVMMKIRQRLGKDFYILPSSIHELIIVPDVPPFEAEELRNTVITVNRTKVDEWDRLSDSVYYFSAEDNKVKRIA